MKAQARRPDPLSVDILPILKTKGGTEVESLERVPQEFPIHQIARMKQGQPRHAMHRGTRELEIRTDSNHVGVRKLVVKERI